MQILKFNFPTAILYSPALPAEFSELSARIIPSRGSVGGPQPAEGIGTTERRAQDPGWRRATLFSFALES
jgi:hypothetical protein